MKAVVVTRHGNAAVLETRDVAEPEAGAGQVKVAVRAAGVNFADVLARLGIYEAAPKPPFVPGFEVAGVIEAVGDGVGGFAPGDRVMGFCAFGGYAQKAVLSASAAVPIPEGMTFSEAAAFPVQYLTAYHGLFQLAHVRSGESVLVHAAAGGVGIACLQLLKPLGCRVFAAVSTDAKAAVVREELPSARVIVSTREDLSGTVREGTGGRGVDVVMDSVGGDVFRQSWNLLAPYGRHVLFGAAAAVRPGAIARLAALWRLRRMLAVFPLKMVSENRSLCAFNLFFLRDRPDVLNEASSELLKLWAHGALKPRVGLSLPLAKASEAHRRMQERQTVGKVVLTVG